jgi:hypothetical protein
MERLSLLQNLQKDHYDNLLYGWDSVRTQRIFKALATNYLVSDLTVAEAHDIFCYLYPDNGFDLNRLYDCFNNIFMVSES